MDALVFSGFTLPIDRVMVGGAWQVIDGKHANAALSGEAYRTVAAQLQSAGGLS